MSAAAQAEARALTEHLIEEMPLQELRIARQQTQEQLAQELGIAQAQAGASGETVQQAGEIATLVGTGRLLDSHKARMRESIGAGLGLL